MRCFLHRLAVISRDAPSARHAVELVDGDAATPGLANTSAVSIATTSVCRRLCLGSYREGPRVCRLTAGGKQIRTTGPTYDGVAFQNTYSAPRAVRCLKTDLLWPEGGWETDCSNLFLQRQGKLRPASRGASHQLLSGFAECPASRTLSRTGVRPACGSSSCVAGIHSGIGRRSAR